ncbi:hypothetical protein A1507_09370 [Methylomonas koyamae]|uniref:Nitroreductase domain-containing protein n=1 Tax=Methylomonas koyamae TaxID=702114 RepID=A0A177NMF5_9GAMM|nr:hypothetical protein [Methylomonas koyamae]OAI18553.1 hypothetical protein A1507_09370 [Methylomonas koyamae]
MNTQSLNKILEAAIRAPSGDNLQPWKIEVSSTPSFTIDLYNLPDKDGSTYNYLQNASYIAHGAFIENIIISAKHFGYSTDIKLFPEETNPDFVARIHFEEAAPEITPLYDAIFKRCTNRYPFKAYEIPSEKIKILSEIGDDIDGIGIHITAERSLINALAKIFAFNDRLVFENKLLHEFVFKQIRWSNAQAEATLDGMHIDTLGLNFLEKLFFPLIKNWPLVELLNIIGLSKIIGLKGKYNCRSASALGVITVKTTNKHNLIRCGQAAQRIWLEAEHQELAFQPIVGLPLLIFQLNQNHIPNVSSKHVEKIQAAERELTNLFNISAQELLVFGFRIGKAHSILTRTYRKSANPL